MKKIISLILSVVIVLGAPVCVAETKIDETLKKTSEYLCQSTDFPKYGSIGGEWLVLGLARSGESVPEGFFENYYSDVAETIKLNKGVLSNKKYTENSRVILALTSIGKDAENIEGYNLIYPLSDFEKTIAQGLNGAIFALIALDCGNYDLPQNKEAKVQATRELYVKEILKSESDGGGWSFGGGKADVDMTAMALQALSKYKDEKNVSEAIERGIDFLAESQSESGGYVSYGEETSESTSQVLTALCALGISPENENFVKNGNSVLDNLLSFGMPNGSFMHTADGSGDAQMSTEQAFYALAAVKRFYNGENALYDMSDVKKDIGKGNDDNGENLKRDEAVNKMPITDESKSFIDIKENQYKPKIEALAARGIVSGKNSEEFDPGSTMTRAEFATIAVRALGISPINETVFDDVKNGDWFYSYAAAAKKFGIISGVSEREFNPNGTVTKEEAVCMVQRAAKLAGLETKADVSEMRDILSVFSDYTETAEWAREALAFCYKNRILPDEEINITPKNNVKRDEMANMIYNLLDKAQLL